MISFKQFINEDYKSFRSWFKGSKVKDANGKPLPVYHGSKDVIDEFKYEFTNKGNDQLGSGFYFTTDENEAKGYGKNIHKVYLNIQKPLDADAKGNLTFDRAMFFIKNAPHIKDINDDKNPLWNWGDLKSENKFIIMKNAAENYTFKNKNLVKGLFNLANDFYPDNVEKFNYKIMSSYGYDGIVKHHKNSDHYVAFFPYQIKSVENEGTWSQEDYNIKK